MFSKIAEDVKEESKESKKLVSSFLKQTTEDKTESKKSEKSVEEAKKASDPSLNSGFKFPSAITGTFLGQDGASSIKTKVEPTKN